ncbi:MAG: RDD family protein [Deltaproteobacteria bacterium]|nr:RDD family protein [Deltaproteobacteria bacterium]
MNSNSFDDEEDQTIVEEKEKSKGTTPPANPQAEEEAEGTVAFVKKSDLSSRPLHRSTLEDLGPLPSFSQYIERFPIQAALPKQRFAAFFIDSLLLFYLVFGFKLILEHFVFPQSFLKNYPNGVLSFSAFLIIFLYYLLLESLWGITFGKWLCHLKVVDLEGFQPKLSSIFLRNFCRLFDYPFAFLVALLSMESSPFYQRLGDRAAQTVVIDKAQAKQDSIDLRSVPLSSTYIRMLSFSFDLVFYFSLLYLTASTLNPEKPYTLYVFGFFLSIFVLGYFPLFEFFTATTPGKFILGRRVIMENGEAIDATAAVIRNFFLPIDVLIAYLLIALSRRKQRLGDLVADTLVIKKMNHLRGRYGFIFLLLLLGFFSYTSYKNPQKHWWMGELKNLSLKTSELLYQKTQFLMLDDTEDTSAKNISSSRQTLVPAPTVNTTASSLSPPPSLAQGNLSIPEFYLSSGPNPAQIRREGQFQAGEEVYLFFKVSGFQIGKIQDVNVSEDAQILNPDASTFLAQKKVVEFNQTLAANVSALNIANSFKLPKEMNAGVYKIILTLRDQLSGQNLNYEKGLIVQSP